MRITLTEVIHRSLQGTTLPFLCRCDDGERYYVKGVYAGRRSLICEWVAGRIALALGLNVPEIRIIEIPEGLLDFSAIPDIRELGRIQAFGSRKVENARDFQYVDIDRTHPGIRARVLLFDWWVVNGDRILGKDGGNPNLLVSVPDENLWVFDHNLAFEQTSIDHFWQNHVFAGDKVYWNREFRSQMIPEMERIRNMVSTFWSELPEEWTEMCNDISLTVVQTLLCRMDCPEDFWGRV